jgi:hypothetical protein
MTVQVVLSVAFNLVMASVLLFAAVRGGRPERQGVVINLAGFGATIAFRLLAPAVSWAPGAAYILAIDICVAGSFFWLGATTTRFWPVWAAGFALADLFMSACGALLPRVSLFAYHTGLGIYAYLALGALALGTFRLARHAEPHIRNGSRLSWLQHLEETN